MHPADLAALGVAPGDVVEIESDHAAILGATIYKDPENHIHSPPHDLSVAIQPGRHEFTRPFALPKDVPEGDYDVIWGIMKTDLTAYYVLEKDLGILHVMAELPPRPEPVAAPGKGDMAVG